MDEFCSYVFIVFKVLFFRLLLKNDQISYCLFYLTFQFCQAFNIKNKHFQMWHTCTMVKVSNTKTTFLSWSRVNKIHFYNHMFRMQSLHISFLYLCESNNLKTSLFPSYLLDATKIYLKPCANNLWTVKAITTNSIWFLKTCFSRQIEVTLVSINMFQNTGDWS